LGKGKTILLPRHPSPDKIIITGILMNTGEFSKFEVISMLPDERWMIKIKNSVTVGLDVDYEKLYWRSYTRFLVESKEFGIQATPEIQRLVELAEKSVQRRTEIGSFSDLINVFYSAQYWNRNTGGNEFSDEQIVQKGVQCISDLIQFSKLKLQRDKWSVELIQKEVQKVGNKGVPRLFSYLQQLHVEMKIQCDIVELITARKHLRGEEEAQQFAAEIVKAYSLANQVFQEAIQICKRESMAKETVRGKIVATNTDNPVFSGAAKVWFKQPAITIQQFTTGHTQIFFRPDIPVELSDNLVAVLREEELKLGKTNQSLPKERRSPEIPPWFYVRSPYGRMLLNASTRAGIEEIAPTKIPLPRLMELAELVLNYA